MPTFIDEERDKKRLAAAKELADKHEKRTGLYCRASLTNGEIDYEIATKAGAIIHVSSLNETGRDMSAAETMTSREKQRQILEHHDHE